MDQPPKHVPHLLHVFSTFAVGGPQIRFVALANALAGRFRHTVLAMDGELAAGAGLAPDAGVSYVRMAVVKTGGISLANVRAARRLLRSLQPDLLVSYNWGAIEWTLADWPFAFCRHIHIEDGFGPGESPQNQDRRRVLTRRLLLRRCALTIVPSRTLYDLALDVWKLPPQRLLYLPNGIDCARFAREADANLVAELGLAGDGPVIGTVAALRREKNLTRLLRIFSMLPTELGAKLLIVGDGPERAPLEAAASELGIRDRVIFAGAIAQPERLLKRIDLFALSSDTEQMPNSILEAMAAGRAVVATDVGDVKRILAAENRPYVVDLADEAGLAAAADSLLRDRALRRRIGDSNFAHVTAEYALDKMVNRYNSLFCGRE